jgi:hypothetical protein
MQFARRPQGVLASIVPDRRRHQRIAVKRIAVTLFGRFMRASKEDYPCRLIDIPAGGAAVGGAIAIARSERLTWFADRAELSGADGRRLACSATGDREAALEPAEGVSCPPAQRIYLRRLGAIRGATGDRQQGGLGELARVMRHTGRVPARNSSLREMPRACASAAGKGNPEAGHTVKRA